MSFMLDEGNHRQKSLVAYTFVRVVSNDWSVVMERRAALVGGQDASNGFSSLKTPTGKRDKASVTAKSGMKSGLCFLKGEPRTTKEVNHPNTLMDCLRERWMTKAVRMTREMRRRSRAIIPMMIDP